MSHTPELTRLFLTGQYEDDINKTNPLGKGGQLAIEYASIMKELWFGYKPVSSPIKFYTSLQHMTTFFPPGQQHDAQVLFLFI